EGAALVRAEGRARIAVEDLVQAYRSRDDRIAERRGTRGDREIGALGHRHRPADGGVRVEALQRPVDAAQPVAVVRWLDDEVPGEEDARGGRLLARRREHDGVRRQARYARRREQRAAGRGGILASMAGQAGIGARTGGTRAVAEAEGSE